MGDSVAQDEDSTLTCETEESKDDSLQDSECPEASANPISLEANKQRCCEAFS